MHLISESSTILKQLENWFSEFSTILTQQEHLISESNTILTQQEKLIWINSRTKPINPKLTGAWKACLCQFCGFLQSCGSLVAPCFSFIAHKSQPNAGLCDHNIIIHGQKKIQYWSSKILKQYNSIQNYLLKRYVFWRHPKLCGGGKKQQWNIFI